MQPLSPPFRRDPAPSRLAYRMQRLWLTPAFRYFLRHGVPAIVVMLGLVLYFGNPARRAAITAGLDNLKTQVEHRPEFMVQMLDVQGASPDLADAVRSMLALHFPVSSFDLDLKGLRAQIESLDAVASADLQVVAGGKLQVTIREREPAMVWRTRDGLTLVDATGHRVASLMNRDARADLPLIAGQGADEAVPEAQAIFAAAGPLAPRIRGLIRIGARRWDIALDRDQTIMLPEDDPVAALERVIALDEAQGVLSRDVTAIDMRLPDRPTIRMSADATAARLAALGLDPKPKTGGATR